MNGPFTPDRATPISEMRAEAEKNGWPLKIDVGLIGSCTNSSYEDISKAASVFKNPNPVAIDCLSRLVIVLETRYHATKAKLYALVCAR